MDYINRYAYFLLEKALVPEHDIEWDIEKGTTKDFTQYKPDKTIIKSLELADNKEDWFKTLISKISSRDINYKKAVIAMVIPVLMLSVGLSKINDVAKGDTEIVNIIQHLPIVKNMTDSVTVDSTKTFQDYINDIAFRESSGRWDISNKHGYMGLFQIGKRALKDIAKRTNDPELKDIHKKVTIDKFNESPDIFPVDLQTKAFKQLLKNNQHYLRNYYDYIDTTINGIHITEAGLLAGAHLVGNGGVKKFLRSNGEKDPVDGNGIHVSEYLAKFANYEVDL